MATLSVGLTKQYQLFYESCLIRPDRAAAVGEIVAKLRQNTRRYEAVGKTLGVPWYVVGIIHSLEAGMNFDRHLHNGDPLSERTTRIPAGRPKTGNPPFTWEASASDALGGQGFGTWKDWSIPAILFKLEEYNGFGYRNRNPPLNSPYLWSFSNHYTRGKYVADGSFSSTAASTQCGAGVLLKRLLDEGARAVDQGTRVLQLSNPNMTGKDVAAAQELLAHNPFGSFDAGTPDGVYGKITAGAVRRAKWELGYPPAGANDNFGPRLAAFLSGQKPLPADFLVRRKTRLKTGASEAALRKKIVEYALWGFEHNAQIAYTQGASRMIALKTPQVLPLATDCSGFATLCYSWAGAPNPNAQGAYDARQTAFTGTMLARCRHISASAVQAGDLVLFSPPREGHHVCMVVTPGTDPMLVSHGGNDGPKKLRLSDELAAQAKNGHAQVTFLSAF